MNKHRHPAVSVIIPVYNTGGVVKNIVTSLLNQKFSNFEILLVNDGSTDNTLSILKELAKLDKRIVVVNQKNQGPSGARNTGIRKASGKYIMFVDSDDNIEGEMLDIMVNKLEESSSDLVVAGMTLEFFSVETLAGKRSLRHPNQTIVNNGLPFRKKIIKSLGSDGRMYSLCNKIFVSEIVKNNKLKLDTSLRFGEDVLFILSYLRHAKKITLIKDVFYRYRQESATSVFSKSALDYPARQENTRATREFLESDDEELQDLFRWLQTRWFISYALIVVDSDMSLKEKLSRIRFAKKSENLQPIVNKKSVSRNKLITQRSFMVLLNSPLVLFLVFKLVLFTRAIRKASFIDINLPKI